MPLLDDTISVGQAGHIADHQQIADKLNDVPNVVRDYGADPTGASNSQTAFTNAIAAAPAGSTIFIPPGTYLWNTSEYTISKSIYLVGAGRQQTTIKTTTGSHRPFRFSSVTGCGIFDLTIDGNYPTHAAGGGVLFDACFDVYVQRCGFENLADQACQVRDSERVWITENYATNCKVSAAFIEATVTTGATRYVWIERNYFGTCQQGDVAGNAPIQLSGPASNHLYEYVYIKGNHVINSGRVGIGADAGRYVEITDNFIVNNNTTATNGEAIAFGGGYALISRNVCRNAKASSGLIWWVDSSGFDSNVIISDNQVFTADNAGIAVVWALNSVVISELQIVNNLCSGNGGVGIQSYIDPGTITGESWKNVLIAYNHIWNNSGGAVGLLHGANCRLVGNQHADNENLERVYEGISLRAGGGLGYLEVEQQTPPGSPASGLHRFYVDSGDAVFKSKDSAGTVSIYGARTRALYFDAEAMRVDQSLTTRLGSGSTAVDAVQLQNALTSGAYFNFIMPVDVIAGTLKVRPIRAPAATDGTAHTVRWQMQIKILTGIDVTTAATAVAWTGDSAARTSNVQVVETGQVSTGVSPAAGDMVRLDVQRVGADAADTYVGAVNLLGVRLDFLANN